MSKTTHYACNKEDHWGDMGRPVCSGCVSDMLDSQLLALRAEISALKGERDRLREALISIRATWEAPNCNLEDFAEALLMHTKLGELEGECRHEETEIGYGLGFGPIGAYLLCLGCGKHLAHDPDPEGVTPEQRAEELAWCKKNHLPRISAYRTQAHHHHYRRR